MKENRVQDKIYLRAILSERANHIVAKMARGCDYSAALLDAQQRFSAVGKDQRDLNDLSDYEGRDAVSRLADLVEHCFGVKISPEQIFCRGIAFLSPIDFEMAAFLGYAIKYLGIAHVQNGLLDVRMHAAMIDKHDPLALIDGEQIAVEWNFGQESGLCTDAVDSFPKAVPQSKIKGFKIANILDIRARYYIRFSLQNSEEAVTKIKNMFQEKNIGIQQLHKKVQQPGAVGHLVIVTHEVNEKNIREVLKTIDGMEFITQMTKMIRIEE